MDIKKVGQAISYLRKRAGFTQKTLADCIGISDKAVSKWERGLSLPDISYLGKLAVLLDTDMESLLAGETFRHDKGWSGLLILPINNDGPVADTMLYDKPLVYYMISYFLLAGLNRVVVAASKEDCQYLERTLGDGSQLGFHLTCCEYELPSFNSNNGISLPEKIYLSLDCSDVMLVHGYSFLYGAGLTRIFQRAMSAKEHTSVLTVPSSKNINNNPLGTTHNIIVPYETATKPGTKYNYNALPIIFTSCYRLRTNSLQPAYAEPLDRGYIHLEINTWDDVADAANIVKILQKSSDLKICDLKEIAYNRGLIESCLQ